MRVHAYVVCDSLTELEGIYKSCLLIPGTQTGSGMIRARVLIGGTSGQYSYPHEIRMDPLPLAKKKKKEWTLCNATRSVDKISWKRCA